MQNEMKDILGRMSAGASGRILASANPSEIRAQQKAVSATVKTGEGTVNITREHKFLSGNQGNPHVKEFR